MVMVMVERESEEKPVPQAFADVRMTGRPFDNKVTTR